jgi:hypothetical protein
LTATPRGSSRSRAAFRPRSTRFEPVQDLRGFTRVPQRMPSGLASRTRHVWQCRTVPALSGLLPALTDIPRIRLSPASTRSLRRPDGEGLPPPLGHAAPRGAPSRSCAPTPRAAHARTPRPGLVVPSAGTAARSTPRPRPVRTPTQQDPPHGDHHRPTGVTIPRHAATAVAVLARRRKRWPRCSVLSTPGLRSRVIPRPGGVILPPDGLR